MTSISCPTMTSTEFRSGLPNAMLNDHHETGTTLENLPVEMLLRVFSYIDHGPLLHTIPRVCRRWLALHTDPGLYQRLDFSTRDTTTSDAVKLLAMAPWLKCLVLHHRTDADQILNHVGKKHSRLETLVVCGCRGSPSTVAVSSDLLRDVLSHCTRLRHLSLQETCCDGEQCYAEIGLRLPSLRYVNYGDACERFSSAALANMVATCSQVEEVRVTDQSWPGAIHISADVVVALCDKFRLSLRVLAMCYNIEWTDATLAAVARCHSLTELNVECAQDITDDGIMALSDMPNLRDITVWGASNVSSDCWAHFFRKPLMKRLQKLAIECKNVDDQVLSAIYMLWGLEDLTLCDAVITDDGIMAIANMPNLSYLGVCDSNLVTSTVWVSLLEKPFATRLSKLTLDCQNIDDGVLAAIGLLSNLCYLDVWLGNATDEGILAITAMPNIQGLKASEDDHISPQGWIRFFEQPNVARVKRLMLAWCENVNDQVAGAIGRHLRQLQELKLLGCKITEQGRQLLQEQIPEHCCLGIQNDVEEDWNIF